MPTGTYDDPVPGIEGGGPPPQAPCPQPVPLIGVPEPLPLTDQHYQNINTALQLAAHLRQDFALAKAAGLGDMVAPLEGRCDAVCQRLEALKRAYFPNRK